MPARLIGSQVRISKPYYIHHKNNMTVRDNLLFVCSHVPSSNAPEAGHKTAWRNIFELSQKYNVDILLITNSYELCGIPLSWPDNVRLIGAFGVSKYDKLFYSIVNVFKWSPRFSVRLSPTAIKCIQAAIKKIAYTRVWFEFTESGALFPFIPDAIPVTLSAPDVIIQWSLRNDSILKYMTPWIYRDELRIFKRADKVIVQSKKDFELIRALYSIGNVEEQRPALAPFLKSVNRSSESVVPHTLLFWGAMSRLENSEAILMFIQSHWSSILAKFPNAQLFVVGAHPPKHLLVFNDTNNIHVTGFLENPSNYFEISSVGIAPLFSGAGIKVKVLEMLEVGLPVISTPIGAEGINACANLAVVDFSEFFDEISSRFSMQSILPLD